MNWKIANAKKNFSELIRKVKKEPQIIYNRNTETAVLIDPDEFSKYKVIKEEKEKKTIAEYFTELRNICIEEDYTIFVPERKNRKV